MKDFKTKTHNYTDEKSFINYYKKDFNQKINKYFKRSSIIDLVTKYELYYHISLGNYAFETLMDVKETEDKLEELHLEVTPLNALFQIYSIIEKYSNEEDFEKNLERYIQQKASLQALDEFVANDSGLLGKDFYKKRKIEEIQNDMFFNDMMRWNFELNYEKTLEHYNLIITDKFIQEIHNRVLNQ